MQSLPLSNQTAWVASLFHRDVLLLYLGTLFKKPFISTVLQGEGWGNELTVFKRLLLNIPLKIVSSQMGSINTSINLTISVIRREQNV